ncbi:MAG: PBSX family phage terminase large subunit [Sphingomonadales bacterium]|nr:PBSX family phage terminase large subunit [Sphingomonadales bacterium]
MRNYALYGGRASSKTYHTAGFCVFLASQYRVKFLCVRQFQARIADSVKSVIEEAIFAAGLQAEFSITDDSISHKLTGSTFTFLGIRRNLREIKGIAGIDVLWIEEAEDLDEEQWGILEPTIRAESSRVLIVFNPRFASDFVWKKFVVNPSSDTLVRCINYDENPYLSSTMRKIIDRMKCEDPDEFEHIYLGVPRDDDDMAVIKRSWIMAAIDAHKALGIDPSGSKRLGFDVADSGKDKCATVFAHGQLVSRAEQWKAGEHELLKSTTRVWNAAIELDAMVVYDSIGVGAGVGAKINELNKTERDGRPFARIQHTGFNAGGEVYRPDAIYAGTRKSNRDMFANIKAQAWWHVADLFRNTYNAVRGGMDFNPSDLIFIDSGIDNLAQLIDELATPRRDFDNAGKVKVESKKDLAKSNREGGAVPSPNLADAFIMAFAPGRKAMAISADTLRAA